jgi:hypothetical protein
VHDVLNTISRVPFGGSIVTPCPAHWSKSVVYSESTLHQIAPFIGKLKSSIACDLVKQFSDKGQTVYDPFSGSTSIGLEAWILGRNVITNDLSPYASLLARAKLHPPATLGRALKRVQAVAEEAETHLPGVVIEEAPPWVAEFFHPDTLREIIAWVRALKNQEDDFLLAALLGILHHQRPGFLSYPSSHTVPYLRRNLFPRRGFPELYAYRSVQDRLERKVQRTFRRIPALDRSLTRYCFQMEASTFVPPRPVDIIITSPPYMQQLDYGRDNRLRLWFLGVEDWQTLDRQVSPSEDVFLQVMVKCFENWKYILNKRQHCILVLGDTFSRRFRRRIPLVVADIAAFQVGGYELVSHTTSAIPKIRRVRRDYCGNRSETVLVLRRT